MPQSYQRELEKIKEVLRENPRGMTILDVANSIGMNRNTVARYLDVLRISGQIEMRAFGSAKVFFLSHRVPVSALIDFSSDALVVVDEHLKIIQVNENFLNMIQMKRKDVEGLYLTDLKSSLFRKSSIVTKIKEAFDEKTNQDIPFEASSGSQYFLVRTIPTSFDTGSPGVTTIFEDITEHKRAEEELRRSEEKYRTLADESPVGIVIFIGNDIKYINTAFSKMVGRNREEILTFQINDTLQYVDERDRERIIKRIEKSDISFKEMELIRIIRPTGETRWIEARSNTIIYEGQQAIQVLLIDATDRKLAQEALEESEKKHRTLVESMSDMVFVFDKDDRYVEYYSSKDAELYAEPDEFLGTHISKTLPPNVYKPYIEYAKVVRDTGQKAQYDYELKINGKNQWFACVLTRSEEQGNIIASVRNITQRKEIEQELKQVLERTQKLESIVNRGPVIVISLLIDKKLTVKFVSENISRLGYSAVDFIKEDRNWIDIIHPEDIGMVREQLNQLEYSNQESNQIYRIITNEGDIRWVSVAIRVLSNRDEKPVHIQGIIHDITEQKEVLQALEDSEQKYRSLVEESLQGIVVLQNGKVVFANDAYCKITGMHREKLYAMEPEETWKVIHPEDVAKLKKRNKTRAQGGYVNPYFAFRYIISDGSIRYVESYSSIINYGGKEALQVLVIDVTSQTEAEVALEESEIRYRSLVETSLHGIIIMQGDRSIYVNNAFCQIIGLAREELLDMKFDEIKRYIHPDDREERVLRFRKWIDGIATENKSEFRLIRPSGEIRYVKAYLSSMEVREDRMMQVQIIDITERRLAEKKLDMAQESKQCLLNTIQDFLFVLDVDGKIIEINPTVTKHLGYSSGDLINTDFSKLFSKEEQIKTVLEIVLHKGSAKRKQIIRSKYGKDIPIETNFSIGPWLGKDAILVLAQDITEQVETDKLMSLQRELGFKLSFMSDLTEALSYILEVILKEGGLDAGGIYLTNFEERKLELFVSRGLSAKFTSNIISVDFDNDLAQPVLTGQKSSYVFAEDDLPYEIQKEGIKSAVSIPIILVGKIVAIINLASRKEVALAENTLRIIEAISNLAGETILRMQNKGISLDI
ncbi:MAG: hypothetical protein BAJATHORv1_30084 [Candidatus Thorarchaeota archaeon]|nr:MAG: hypothetical protein BAJATHORv1_30084 [Candidatus Thorarchaeota archaeon]